VRKAKGKMTFTKDKGERDLNGALKDANRWAAQRRAEGYETVMTMIADGYTVEWKKK
jgi:Mg-chelatase subunit ChlD